MSSKDIYQLSNKFAPPKVDLRQARIQDDYGDESYARIIVNHKAPHDVKKEELAYYSWICPFLEPEDLIFYLYSVLTEYKKDNGIEFVDSFMYSMERELNNLLPKLNKEETITFKKAFLEIWDIGSDDEFNEWYQCKNIQSFIGVKSN